MSGHWRLATWCVIWVSAVAAVVGALIWARYGSSYAGALEYGVGVGIVSFFSGALTVSFLTGQNKVLMLVGAGSFVVRYFYVAAALGLPAHWGLWPATPMIAGFAGAYFVENVVLLPGFVKVTGRSPHAGKRREETVERRVEV